MELRCAIFDYETTTLLVEAGAIIIEQDLQVSSLLFLISLPTWNIFRSDPNLFVHFANRAAFAISNR